MKRIKCYKNGRLVSSNLYKEGMLEHLVFMAKSNAKMITNLVVTENGLSFTENNIVCKVVVS